MILDDNWLLNLAVLLNMAAGAHRRLGTQSPDPYVPEMTAQLADALKTKADEIWLTLDEDEALPPSAEIIQFPQR